MIIIKIFVLKNPCSKNILLQEIFKLIHNFLAWFDKIQKHLCWNPRALKGTLKEEGEYHTTPGR